MAYDSPDKVIERDAVVAAAAGGGATTTYGKFRSFVATALLNITAVVTTAGTAAGHGFDVYNGTTSIATIPLGTAAADTVVTVALNLEAAALAAITVKSKADVVGLADIVLQYREAQ